jgi:transposase
MVAGIDVGSKDLHVVVRKGNRAMKVEIFKNTHEGFGKLVDYLRQHKVRRVVLEATGIYHLDLALALDVEPTIEVMVLNPKAAKRYAQARMTRSKTDAIDAAMLAEYAQHMPFDPWQPPGPTLLALRACARRLAALTRQRTRSKNQLHALSNTRTTPRFLLDDVRLSIIQFDNQIVTLQARTVALIQEDQRLKYAFDQLLSIKGIGEKSAIQVLGELSTLPEDMRAKQWVAMAGLDPRHHQSGTSVDKKARISKVGNRYLRTALYMPAMCAARHVPEIRAYYIHLVEHQGLKKIQALCAVMRKLLHAIHGMWRSGELFDPSRFYPAYQTEA